MRDKPKVLLVEDSLSLATVYQAYLKDEPIDLHHTGTGRGATSFIEKHIPEVVLLDLKLPDMTGEEVLSWIQEQNIPSATAVITAHGSVDVAVDIMRLGAVDFLQKPIEASRLLTTLRNVLENTRLRNLLDSFSHTFERNQYHGFIGASLPMQAAYQIIDAAAPSKATIFITGESGTGKEVCAQAIHQQSQSKDGPFIAINCGAIPGDLMESEIFGHVKGAFTGALNERQGAASQAHKGTLFLDEIAEMSMDLQTKLLRFIQSGIIKKVGGSKDEKVDVRFICATNKDPLEEVNAGRFREDLYYRLNVVPLHLPPLRTRGDDIILLAKQFLITYAKEDNKEFTRFSADVLNIFKHYNWPGNVRQLQNVIRNIVVLHNQDVVQTKHLPPPLNTIQLNEKPRNIHASPINGSTIEQGSNVTAFEQRPSHIPSNTESPAQLVEQGSPLQIEPLALVERRAIENAIAYCDGNIPKAAALLDVSPSTIYRKKQTWA